MKTLVAFLVLAAQPAFSASGVTVLWNFQPECRDVLEYQTELGGTWAEVSPPYALTPDGLDYRVVVPLGNEPRKFFRVSRVWGEPLITPSTAQRSLPPLDTGR